MPEKFVLSVISLLQNSRAAIMMNGHRGVAFPLERGVPQGDPMSPLLYALALEPFLDRVQHHLTGLEVWGISWKIGAFADDMVVGLGSQGDIVELQESVQWLEEGSGQKLNWDKCETLPLGNGLIGGTIVGKIIPNGEAVWYLGIYFSVYGTTLMKTWWTGKLEEWIGVLNGWGGQHISLAGRAMILNIYWLPKLWYLGYHLDFPPWVIRGLMKAARHWLWAG
jgi:hypothetical protein